MINSDPKQVFLQLLLDRGFVETDDVRLIPLTGGVSSEIYLVEEGERRFVVKRALAKLKVEAEWLADTSRNRSEQAYMRYVHAFRPDAIPNIYRSDNEAGLFSMEYLEGFRNWKQDLLAHECDPKLASRAGTLLGEIHARSWGDLSVMRQFDTIPNFDQLRIDPYLRATATKHPALKEVLLAEAHRLTQSRQCLSHGDYSPKNMLHRDGRLVVLDCEVACYADAAFDLSFFLNHLFLKGLYHAPDTLPLEVLTSAARTGYREANGHHADEVEAVAARLLPMLLLARVDGKSPVEYLTPTQQNFIRQFVPDCLSEANLNLDRLATAWFASLCQMENL